VRCNGSQQYPHKLSNKKISRFFIDCHHFPHNVFLFDQLMSNEHKSKEGIATHTKARVAALTRTQDESEHTKAAHQSYNSKKCSNL
jgi:glutamate racemase